MLKISIIKSLIIVAVLGLICNNPGYSQNNNLFNSLLRDFVKNGKVNYAGMKDDKRLDKYIASIENTDPDKLSTGDSKFAFWINVYNAFTLKLVCTNYPIKSISDLNSGGKLIDKLPGKTVWDKKFISINKKDYSLNDIENNILRKKFDEPRVHFALVCASVSCPLLMQEAFSGEKLNSQLDQQARLFLNDTTKNSFNLNSRIAYISQIFNWFRKDFGKNDIEILNYISQFLPDDTAKDIIENAQKWTIKYKNYDWRLNKQ
ncbi:MAG TPA: DUF547 domain-containing protein [Ignavibacteriaceae bacterium]|nr:DUF547 domain-containing protein [Ignavibacteriaceae bacterium]